MNKTFLKLIMDRTEGNKEKFLRQRNYCVGLLRKPENGSLRKIYGNTAFLWPVFSRIRTESCPYKGKNGSEKTRTLAYFTKWVKIYTSVNSMRKGLLTKRDFEKQ